AAVVEFDPLPDAVRAAAEDDHARAIAALHLVLGAPLPARVVVRRARGELGRAGVDGLERALAGLRGVGIEGQLADLVEEPGVDRRARAHLVDARALAEGLDDHVV